MSREYKKCYILWWDCVRRRHKPDHNIFWRLSLAEFTHCYAVIDKNKIFWISVIYPQHSWHSFWSPQGKHISFEFQHNCPELEETSAVISVQPDKYQAACSASLLHLERSAVALNNLFSLPKISNCSKSWSRLENGVSYKTSRWMINKSQTFFLLMLSGSRMNQVETCSKSFGWEIKKKSPATHLGEPSKTKNGKSWSFGPTGGPLIIFLWMSVFLKIPINILSI